MKGSLFLVNMVSFFILIQSAACNPPDSVMIGFYNMENLFDTLDDPKTNDRDFLPDSDYNWNTEKYRNKLHNLSSVIASMNSGYGPTLLGVCEIENKKVLDDLTKQALIKNKKYAIVHFESADERGIDVGLLYKKEEVKIIHSGIIRPEIPKDKTRDVLYVRAQLTGGEKFWVMVCHLPSRREGQQESEPKRMLVANLIAQFKDSLIAAHPTEKIFIIGDFNDEPSNESMKIIAGTNANNVAKKLAEQGKGTITYNSDWYMFDQIIYYQHSTASGCKIMDNSAEVFDPSWLKQHGNPKYEGTPLRTFGGRKYLNGYSDHFPVSIKMSCKNP